MWKTVGTYDSREAAEDAAQYARPSKRRRCTRCPARFRPKDDRQVRCRACIARFSPPKRDDHWVYRCYAEDGRLLYVGITSNGIKRFRRHGNERDWWPDTARIEIEHFESRKETEDRERELIRELKPPYNTRGKP
jgi:hypothetical protein